MTVGELFSVYFPSGAGFMSGTSASGDLKDPSTAIPKGIILGLIVTASFDMSICWLTGLTTVRFSSGSVDDLRYMKSRENVTGEPWYLQDPPCLAHPNVTFCDAKPDEGDISYGTAAHMQLKALVLQVFTRRWSTRTYRPSTGCSSSVLWPLHSARRCWS